jgi:dTDP-4-amino-4,6-dideoxygalactose transaminase
MIAARYANELENIGHVTIPFKERIKGLNGERPSYHLFPILVKDIATRDGLMKWLKKRGIQTSIHYPPVHLFTYYSSRFGIREGVLPNTEHVSGRLLTLPLYGTLREEQVTYVIESVREFFKGDKATI